MKIEDTFEFEQFMSHKLVDWQALGLRVLSDKAADVGSSNRTVEALTVRFEEQVADALSHQQWEWEERREEYLRWRPKTPATGPVEHPWGDDTVAVCRKWLAAPATLAFEVFQFVQGEALEAAKDSLSAMLVGDEDGKMVKEAADKALQAKMTEIAKRLKAEAA